MDDHELSRMVTLEVTIKNLEDNIKCLNTKISALDKRLDQVNERLSGWRGGLLAIVGLASILGITFASVVTYLKGL